MQVPAKLTSDSVVRLRRALTQTARLIANAKRPTQVIGAAGLRVNQVAHDSVEQLVKHQVHVIEGVMDESAQRLQLAAEAGSIQSLLNEQVALLPETRARLSKDVRTALEILGSTRTGLASALREEIGTLREMAGNAADDVEDAAKQAGERVEAAVTDVSEVA
jgi:phasin family protein